MDRCFSSLLVNDVWSGVVQSLHGDSSFQTLAFGHSVVVTGLQVDASQKVALYDWKIASKDPITLVAQGSSHSVLLPEETDFTKLKELCAGIGCIGIAGRFLGITTLATMDINQFAVNTQRANFGHQALCGDALSTADQVQFHLCPHPARGWISSGFPCQPLSTQGDMKGQADTRSDVFHATLEIAWQQQAAGLLLECVPGAAQAQYVQSGIQKLAWSLGMDICQRILHLQSTWPSKRTRWWALIAPKPYVPIHIADLPNLKEMHSIAALFPQWPTWSPVEEGLLQLTEQELTIYGNPAFGDDLRHLQSNLPCPCILHSYGSVLQACPCGCRSGPFTMTRLLQGGVRGFYVRSSRTGHFRFLHPREAAALCAIPPNLAFLGQGRDSLCLIGQSASPLQAIWMWANFFKQVVPGAPEPQFYITSYIMYMLKEIHGGFLFHDLPAQVLFRRECGDECTMTSAPSTTIAQWRTAEQNLMGWGQQVTISDEQGTVPDHHILQNNALLGTYTVVYRTKKQSAIQPNGIANVTFAPATGAILTCGVPMGSLLFEVLHWMDLPRTPAWMDEHTQAHFPLDQRIWHSISLVQIGAPPLRAAGWTHTGLGNYCLDWMGKKLLAQSSIRSLWLPSQLATQAQLLVHSRADSQLMHWSTTLLHGTTFTCVAIQGHWILLRLRISNSMLLADCWDGLQSAVTADLLPGLTSICAQLGLRPLLLEHHCQVPQTLPMTCGAVALLHLGLELGIWADTSPTAELLLHKTLHDHFFSQGTLMAFGFGGKGKGTDSTMTWQLRDLLEAHGVPSERTEERATLAISKIGGMKIQEALATRNPWASLKALGSQPKVNFMWVKADELDAQIKKKAQSKFKVQTSSKKQPNMNRGAVSSHHVDPTLLKIIPGSFIMDDDTVVTQIEMSTVQAHRTGIAYGTLEDAAPFLQEDRSISLDGLAILTTTRIPPDRLGLLPATNMRIPALFGPTEEPILLDGSLLNLGDKTITRKQESKAAPSSDIPTATLKLVLFRDETQVDWAALLQSPLRVLMQRFQLLTLCRGQRCGDACGKFHAPVDQDMDAVLLDVWSRTWLSNKGRKVPQEQAEVFQVFVRVAAVCQLPIQRLSGTEGFYVEPRQTDGRGADPTTTVVWIPQGDLATALHKAKTIERAIAVARFGNKFGIRVFLRDAEATHQAISPNEPFLNFEIQKVWELRPLPHGTQKTGLLTMLRAWEWQAKPLQPCRADAAGMGWLVGSTEDPPSKILMTDPGDITVSLHKKPIMEVEEHAVWSSSKTKALLRKSARTQVAPRLPIQHSSGGPHEDPWMKNDPWSSFRPTTGPQTEATDVPMNAVSMIEQVEERLRGQLASTSASDPRIAQLETDVHEIKEQNHKFEQWFQQAGQSSTAMQGKIEDLTQQILSNDQGLQQVHTQMAQTSHRVEEVASQVVANRGELSSLDAKITSGFANLEGLLSKKLRAE